MANQSGYGGGNGGNGSNANGSNGYARRWQTILALGISLLTFGKVVFFAGGSDARVEEHLRFDDAKLDRLEAECAKAREIDLQIQAIKDSQHRLEQTIDRATAQLDAMDVRRKPR